MDSKNPSHRNEDCRTDDFFPEVCYPKNDTYWKRLTVCDEQGDFCEMDLSGLRRPNATPLKETEGNPGTKVGNDPVSVGCPAPYSGAATVDIPADQFVRFIADARDTVAIDEARQFVNNLANLFAQTQLNCYAENEAQTADCPAAPTNESLRTSADTSTTVAAGLFKVKLGSVGLAQGEEERLAVREDTSDVGDYIIQLNIDAPNFFKINGYVAGLAQYNAPVSETVAYADLHALDLEEANSTAQSRAFAGLDCVYGNEAVTLYCPNDTDGVAPVQTAGTPVATAPAHSFTYRLVDIEDGPVQDPDQTGLDSLTVRARDLAVTLLQCVWWSKSVSVSCPTLDDTEPACTSGTGICGFGGEEGDKNRPPDPVFIADTTVNGVNYSPLQPSSTTVARGQYKTLLTFPQGTDPLTFPSSSDNVAELTEKAVALAQALVQCRYENNAYSGAAECCPDGSTIPTLVNATVNLVNPGATVNMATVTPTVSCDLTQSSEYTETNQSAELAPPLPDGFWKPFEEIKFPLNIDKGEIIRVVSDPILDLVSEELEHVEYMVNNGNPQALKVEMDQAALDSVCAASAICFWGNEALVAAHCDPTQPNNALRAQDYEDSTPSDLIPANTFINTTGKYQVQELAVTVALASRVCQPKLVGNIGVALPCATPTSAQALKVVYWPNASIEPTIAADTFLDVDVCAATELALAVAIATKLCAYTNNEVTSECPTGTTSHTPKITLFKGTIIDYSITADPTGTAQTLANASRICTAIIGDSDNPFEEEVPCGLKLTGAYTQEAGAPNINSIEWSVTSGDVKHENSVATAAAYSGGNTTSYDLYKPHFYASFAVDEAGFQIPNTTITVEQSATKTSTDFTILDTTGYLYIGSFVDFGPTVTNTTTGVTNGQIVVANAICAPDPYKYSLKQTQQFEGYPLTSESNNTKTVTFSALYVHDAILGGEPIASVPTPYTYAGGDSFHVNLEVDADQVPKSVTIEKTGASLPANTTTNKYFKHATESTGVWTMARSAGIIWFGSSNTSSSSGGSMGSSSAGSSTVGSSTGGSSAGGGSSTGGSTTPPSAGSSKDTAVVPAPWLGTDKYTALFVEEQPEVIFSDHFDVYVGGRETRKRLDRRFFAVCEPGTIKVVGVVPDQPESVGVMIDAERQELVVRTRRWFSKVKRVSGRISGTRLGFKHLRFPTKSQADFEANETWIKRGNS